MNHHQHAKREAEDNMRALFILDNGNGTVRIKKEESWNSPSNKPNQLAKFDMDKDLYPAPPVGVKYLAWNGSMLVEASQEVQDAITDKEDADAQEKHDADAPSGGLANWSKKEKFFLLVFFKLAKLHYPNITKESFLTTLKAEWDAIRE